VLQAAIASAAPISPTVRTFWNIFVLLYVTAQTNADAQERVHSGSVIFQPRAME
jgi:hypothetical protein